MAKDIWVQTRIWQAIFKYKQNSERYYLSTNKTNLILTNGIQVQINSEHKIKSLDIEFLQKIFRHK